jgi:hypothetical protein
MHAVWMLILMQKMSGESFGQGSVPQNTRPCPVICQTATTPNGINGHRGILRSISPKCPFLVPVFSNLAAAGFTSITASLA